MSAGIKSAWLVGLVLAAPQLGSAQDREFPVLNSVGRYLGIGYTCGGYHAAYDGRMDIVTSRHPASAYRPGGLAPHAMPLSQGDNVYGHPPASEARLTPLPAVPESVLPESIVPESIVPESVVPESVVPESVVPESAAFPGTAILDAMPFTAVQSPRGLPPGVVTLPPPPSAQPLPIPPIASPAVITSPRDRIEVRELAPSASPSDALLDHDSSHRMLARDVDYSRVNYSILAPPDNQPQSNGTSGNRYLAPPLLMHPH